MTTQERLEGLKHKAAELERKKAFAERSQNWGMVIEYKHQLAALLPTIEDVERRAASEAAQ
jgi:hypothetical protein